MNPALTTLASVKQWAAITDSNSDAVISALIPRISQSILTYLNRDSLYQTTYTDYYDGNNGARKMLRNWPVLSVSSLYVGSTLITSAGTPPSLGTGFFLEPANGPPPGRPQNLNLRGHRFCAGLSNVQVTYTAGYVIQNEAQIIPAVDPRTITAFMPYGNWMDDSGVQYASGGALTKVSANPAQGQYAVSAGVYTFNAADGGVAVLLSYSYVPRDVEQACIEWIWERLNYKSRPGQTSKTLGGQETMGYTLESIPRFVALSLQQYARTVLI